MIIQALAELHFLSSSEPRRSFCASLPNCARCNCRYPMAVAFGQVAVTEQMVQHGSAVFLPCKTRPGKIQTRNFMEFHGISSHDMKLYETLENAMISLWSAFISFQSSDLALYSPLPRGDPKDRPAKLEASRLPHNHLSNEEKLQILDA